MAQGYITIWNILIPCNELCAQLSHNIWDLTPEFTLPCHLKRQIFLSRQCWCVITKCCICLEQWTRRRGVRNVPDGSTTCLSVLEAKGRVSPGTDIAHIGEAGEEPLALLVGEHRLELCWALEVIHCHVQTAQVGRLRYYQLKLGLERENKGAQHQYTARVCEKSYGEEQGKEGKPPSTRCK